MWLSNTSEQADAGTPLGSNLGHGRPDARDVGGVPPLEFQPVRGIFRLEMDRLTALSVSLSSEALGTQSRFGG